MRGIVRLGAMVLVVGCANGHQITVQDVMNAQACMNEVRTVPQAVQSSIPSCMTLANQIKTEGSQ